MAIIHVTNDNFEAEVLQSDKPVVIDFWAVWCGPCQMLGPVFEEMSNEVQDVKFVKVNVDEEPDLASRYGVMSIPTLILIKDGKPEKTMVGLQSKEAILNMIHS